MVKAGHDEDKETELSVDAFTNVWFAMVIWFIKLLVIYLKIQVSLEVLYSTKTNVDPEHKK